MRNFARINNYYNRQQALEDWAKLAATITKSGHRDLVQKHRPNKKAGWRMIDKAIAALRKEYHDLVLGRDKDD